jgi:ATP-dependent DNA helicase PIF1
MDCVNAFLSRFGPNKGAPFGGVQLIFFGDLFQLPPVVTRDQQELFRSHYEGPYFFNAHSFKDVTMKMVELREVYRQKEESFIQLLNKIRDNSVDGADMAQLNQRFQANFAPDEEKFYIYLTTTNALAENINQKRLKELKSDAVVFDGDLAGDFKNPPTSQALQLKVGAQVMLLNNDSKNRWSNGSIGKVINISLDAYRVTVELSNGTRVDVEPFQWEMYKFYYDEDLKALASDSVGYFEQFPLKLAWAVTIHKSQGQTFPRVVIDIGSGTFSHGQAYVALSRCTNFEGMTLRRPFMKHHIMLDPRVVDFYQRFERLETETT